jgi:putative PEP-CTERM system TPR-repeat lipoprotein
VTPRLELIAYYLRSKDTKKAVTAAQDAQAAIPDRPEILEALARAQQAAGDFNQAIMTYGKWARVQPSSPLPWLRMANAQIAAKDTTGALQSLRKALEIQPESVDAQRGIMTLDLAADRVDEALAIARTVQKQRPKEAIGYLLEGDVYVARKAWAKAAAAYRAGLKQVADTHLAARLYDVLGAGGNMADAEMFSKAWVKDHPKDKVFRLFVAEKAVARKDFASAHKQYQALLELDPNDAGVLNNLAWTAGQTKDPKALEYAEKANVLAPNQPAILDTLGTLLIEKGDTVRGIETLRKASELAPEMPLVRLNLAKGLIKTQQKEAAKKELQELAKLGNKFPAQAEVTNLMQGL